MRANEGEKKLMRNVPMLGWYRSSVEVIAIIEFIKDLRLSMLRQLITMTYPSDC